MTLPDAIVTDIEGTTSSIDFVHEVLFPYARERIAGYVREHRSDEQVRSLLDDLRDQIGAPEADVDQLIATLLEWIDEDRKATPLKTLQGFVWEQGYRNGYFTGHVYEDAARRLREWHASGVGLYVYSSGSVKAQKLLFRYSDAGDLTPLFTGYFDTTIGHKQDAASYEAIANTIGLPAAEILFLSDSTAELDAAARSGMRTVQVARDPAVLQGRHSCVHDFDELEFQA